MGDKGNSFSERYESVRPGLGKQKGGACGRAWSAELPCECEWRKGRDTYDKTYRAWVSNWLVALAQFVGLIA